MKCTFVIPYFGKLPNYFNVFLKSCELNPNYRWIVFTDDKSKYQYPSNVNCVFMTFDDMKKYIQSKFNFEIKIDDPHKLCDYKPAYGYIFEEYLKDSNYWGHCDIDTVLGNLDKFLDPLFQENYDKLFCLGHMILYKNSYENNRMFMKPMEKQYWYKESFSTSETTVFDEMGCGSKNVNEIFKRYSQKVYMEDLSMNCSVVPTRFVKVTYNWKTDSFITERKKDALYVWDKGNLYRVYMDKNKKICREDFLYIHLQLRNMKFSEKIKESNRFKILEDRFDILEENICRGGEIDAYQFKKIKRHVICCRYLKMQIKWKYAKIKRFFTT